MNTAPEPIVEDDAIHGHFGLSYANYLVLHRSLMQSMPGDWQRRMVACLDELDAAFDHVKQAPAYKVEAAEEREVGDLSDRELKRLDIERSDTNPDIFYNERGDEMEHWHRVMVPLLTGDPVPQYNRGRTFIAPRVSS